MKAEELRLGNKIYCDDLNIDTGKWHQKIIDVGYRDIYNLTNGHDMVKGAYEGIPLTEEWLLKCGFTKDDVFDKLFIYLNNNEFDTDKLSFRVSEGFICFDGIKYRTILKHVNYLHQLQNLYFALTNEELTIKE